MPPPVAPTRHACFVLSLPSASEDFQRLPPQAHLHAGPTIVSRSVLSRACELTAQSAPCAAIRLALHRAATPDTFLPGLPRTQLAQSVRWPPPVCSCCRAAMAAARVLMLPRGAFSACYGEDALWLTDEDRGVCIAGECTCGADVRGRC
jgi:hypothetical protein